MELTDNAIRDMVRKVVLRTLGREASTAGESSGMRVPSAAGRSTITEVDVLAVPPGGTLAVPAGALLTPLATDTARDRRVQLVREPGAPPAEAAKALSHSAPAPGTATARSVALGADHGGFGLKEELKAYVAELGYAVIDCGTHSTAAVDYPDLAYAVATLVAEGRAWRGIVIDGAGIGSCMAANKVPGVRAAMCYDHATAVNAREHNDANVLTLGGSLIGANLARQIVKVWLETAFGGGRHAHRVDKIMGIERRYLKSRV